MRYLLFSLSFFFINSLAFSSEGFPHEPKSIMPYGFFVSIWILFFSFLFLLALILGLFFYKRFKSNSEKSVFLDLSLEVKKKISLLTPEEPFLKKQQEIFYYELGFNLRHYLELKTGVSATDLTFKELRTPLMKAFESLSLSSGDVLEFLGRSELIKFSQKLSTSDEARKSLGDVLVWLDKIDEAVSKKEKDESLAKKGASS